MVFFSSTFLFLAAYSLVHFFGRVILLPSHRFIPRAPRDEVVLLRAQLRAALEVKAQAVKELKTLEGPPVAAPMRTETDGIITAGDGGHELGTRAAAVGRRFSCRGLGRRGGGLIVSGIGEKLNETEKSSCWPCQSLARDGEYGEG